jgi:hypothetical protein
MRKIKVFCGRPMGTYTIVCACYSLKNYCDITGYSYSWARSFVCETHNPKQVEVAMKSPLKPVKIESDY